MIRLLRIWLFTAACAVSIFAPGLVSADAVNITASTNAFVFRGSANSDQSESQYLWNKELAAGNARTIYLRFPLATLLSSYSVSDITSVTLRMYRIGGSTTDNETVYAILDTVNGTIGFDGQWTSNMTWSNQPADLSASVALPNSRTTSSLGSKTVGVSSGEVRISLNVQTMLGLLANDSNQQITLLLVNSSATIGEWASIANTNGQLQPTLEVVVNPTSGSARTLTWNGAVNGNWDTTTANWKTDVASPAVAYQQNDRAIFDQTLAGNSTINLTTTLTPTSLTVNNSSTSYAFTGTGKISGVTGIIKQGTGTLTLGMSGGNAFVGPVNVAAGKLVINHANAPLGNSSANVTIANGATLDLGGAALATNALSLSNIVTVSGNGIGGAGAIVNSGAAQQNALRSVTLAGDTTFGGSGRWDIRSSGNVGVLNTGGQAYKLTKTGTGQMTLVSVTVDPALANIDVLQGILSVESNTETLGNPASTVSVSSGASLQFYQLTNTLNKKVALAGGATLINQSGTNILSGPITLNGAATFNISGTSLTASNTISGTGSFTKTGTGNLILEGTHSFSGGATLSAGKLTVNGPLTGSGTLTTASGSVLASRAAISGAITASGQIYPGDLNAPGTLTSSGLTLNSGATVTFELGATNSDLIQVNGNLVLNNNTITINPLSTPQIGVKYRLVNYTGTRTGTFNPVLNVDANYFAAALDYSVAGQINVIFSVAHPYLIPAEYPTGTGTANVTIAADGKLTYLPDAKGDTIPDFSNCGYGGGAAPIPDVPVVTTLSPIAGNNQPQIQSAINAMSSRAIGPDGFRGAILLTAGTYTCNSQIDMNVSGVVLRGAGTNATNHNNQSGGDLFDISNGSSGSTEVANTRHNLIDTYVPLGAKWFRVDSTSGLSAGDTVNIIRPSPQNWIDDIGMGSIWSGGSYDMKFDRTIVAIEQNRILLDAPLAASFDALYGGGYIYKYTWSGRLNHVGVEKLQITGGGASFTVKDLFNGWIRQIFINKVNGHGMDMDGGKWQTVEDIDQNRDEPNPHPDAPQSYFFFAGAQLSLFHRLISTYGGHDFSSATKCPGPNVYLECWSQSYSGSGPHMRLALATLYDSLRCGQSLDAINAGTGGTGHGWTGANGVMWNCEASSMKLDRPNTMHQWGIGIVTSGTRSGSTNEWISSNTHVQPGSLYRAQLAERVGRAQADLVHGVPDGDNHFELSATTDQVTLSPGQSANQVFRVNYSAHASAQPVTLTMTGLPAGLTATLDKTSVTASGDILLSVNAASSVPPGSYRLTVTGRGSFSTIANTTIQLTRTRDFLINISGSSPFSITATPASRTVVPPGSTTFTTQVTGNVGFAGSVALSVSGLPAGVTANFNPTSVTGSGQSTLTVTIPDGTLGGSYPLLITGTSAGQTSSALVTLVLSSTALPDPWTNQDIGGPSLAGNSGYDGSTGIFTVAGAGTDIWNNSDEFQFANRAESGDCTITARVITEANTNAFAKAGVMIRESTSGGSKHVSVMTSPTNVAMFRRQTAGSTSENLTGWGTGQPPYWVRLVRSGSIFTGFKSSDGQTWTQIAQTTVTMNNDVIAGLAVTSHDTTKICTATFDNVTVDYPDFYITAAPDTQAVDGGASTTYTVSVTGINAFSGPVTLSASDLPAGITASFSPAIVTAPGTSTLTLTTSQTTPGGFHTITLTGTNAALSLSHESDVSLDVTASDADNDSIPDFWMLQYFGHATGQAADQSRATDDADGDGASNLTEELSGTNPTDPNSFLRIKSIAFEGNDVRITWMAVGDKRYVVEAGSDLSNPNSFTEISPILEVDGSGDMEAQFVDVSGATTGAVRFYRIRLIP